MISTSSVPFNRYHLPLSIAICVLKEGELYYAFNKDVDTNLIDELQQAIDKVKTSINDSGINQYDAIINKYQ
ncbi:hypothetical protein [Vibrio genomosp. F10]|uniref:Uncharacterized protein n=1 Tax=Vibrio genomosp. F10 str. ZF-129 TaxID=1187848 RepID=A0A1E5BFZ7_9VIBR|nr:hypothetical protein [Vibrio genomosp. F10]OEE34650.1 hypothetical protein A1QO_07385 [Vibrio genomosp. F10 str. ZF-129]OEE93761.1 hypothetical protein A1QM_08245 [Vibrio genomosp. F10 str. 9ZC157]OEF03693.1 hypothetical protein A1QK_10450 [Vibrio genomosp. F10 str. 9ZD137]OEF05124.1 hypothetical protein A1QI_08700 [Vibrio genomosp. F10 str. 9ZB36]